MEHSATTTEYYFNKQRAVSARLDYTLEWFEELGANLMEPSTIRTTENIAELRGQREIAARDMGILAARLSELKNAETVNTATALDAIITNSELVEVS